MTEDEQSRLDRLRADVDHDGTPDVFQAEPNHDGLILTIGAIAVVLMLLAAWLVLHR